MRWAAIVVFSLGCLGSQRLVRTQVVDGRTGAPRAATAVTVETELSARRNTSFCRKTEYGDLGIFGDKRSGAPEEQRDRVAARTDGQGWLDVVVPSERGYCQFTTSDVQLRIDRGTYLRVPLDRPTAVVPTFDDPPVARDARTFTALRAQAAFSPEAAVRSAYAERFSRRWRGERLDGDVPVYAAPDGRHFLAGPSAKAISPDEDGGDPWRRLVVATVAPAGASWRVELRALDATLRDGLPIVVVPPPLADVPAAVAAAREWQAQALAEQVARRARADDALGQRWHTHDERSKLLRGDRGSSEVEVRPAGGGLIAWFVGYGRNDDSIDVIELQTSVRVDDGVVALGPVESRAWSRLFPVARPGDLHLECQQPSLIVDGVRLIEPSPTCRADAAGGCALGVDPRGRAWHATCTRAPPPELARWIVRERPRSHLRLVPR